MKLPVRFFIATCCFGLYAYSFCNNTGTTIALAPAKDLAVFPTKTTSLSGDSNALSLNQKSKNTGLIIHNGAITSTGNSISISGICSKNAVKPCR